MPPPELAADDEQQRGANPKEKAAALYEAALERIAIHDFGTAVGLLNRAIRLNGSEGAYLSSRALAFRKMNRWNEAIADYTAARRFGPRAPPAAPKATSGKGLLTGGVEMATEEVVGAGREPLRPEPNRTLVAALVAPPGTRTGAEANILGFAAKRAPVLCELEDVSRDTICANAVGFSVEADADVAAADVSGLVSGGHVCVVVYGEIEASWGEGETRMAQAIAEGESCGASSLLPDDLLSTAGDH
jgi:tetratricopeptide (TPR) repeat protein